MAALKCVVIVNIFWKYCAFADMLFGVMEEEGVNDIHAIAVMTGRRQIHGGNVRPGNACIEIKRVLKPGLLPMYPTAFDMDEPISVGGFYEWPTNRLAIMQTK